ncbi:MAG: DNA photolyase [Desulfobulbaceae bacterium]|jgi:spore photoproduct lyase|nr:DNA photolyase [Desulfobulbaceae bacterium]
MSWADPSRYLERILVEASCLSDEYCQDILRRAALPWQIVTDDGANAAQWQADASSWRAAKKTLMLHRYQGRFFKPCPGTREYRCCGYQVLTTGFNCPMDCVYCILQAYLNRPWTSVFINISDLCDELALALTDGQPRRIGSGEFTDSLALDRITGLSQILVPFFARRDNAVLELKTKSAVVENLEGLDHNGHTIVAWSLNSPEIMRRQEARSASLDERLEAARRCAAWGYRLAFHFDPLILHNNWRQGYRQTITALFAAVPPEAIAWISLGALRFLPPLKQIAVARFPQTEIYRHEFIDGLDGKRRYFRPRRVELYQFVYQELRRFADPATCIYFCMESDEIWREVMGFSPEEKGGLAAMLDRAAFPNLLFHSHT